MRGALLFSLAFGAQGDGDRWFGPDKVKHFLTSAFVQGAAYATLQAAGADRGAALAGATAVTLTVGVGKEWLDRRQGGAVSRRDLAWDVAGAGAATLVLVRTER
jgi:putative lipoprotein